jgi:hypothetical protein
MLPRMYAAVGQLMDCDLETGEARCRFPRTAGMGSHIGHACAFITRNQKSGCTGS